MKRFLIAIVILLSFITTNAQVVAPKLGAYYFDGWKKIKGNSHLTPLLLGKYSEREPKWGWVTSTQKNVDNQILAASDAGLNFFSFCWYYNKKYAIDSSNRALSYYNNSKYKSKLNFCLMVANHEGYEIGPTQWNTVCNEWIKQFKSNKYVTVDGKPLLIFFSAASLIEKFKSTENVNNAFKEFRKQVKSAGLNGVSIAVCVGNSKKEIRLAGECGFDILTGYNYHGYGLINRKPGISKVPIQTMQTVEKELWTTISNMSNLPYIPVPTLNWDARPWKSPTSASGYFFGFSSSSVYTSVTNCIGWMNSNPSKTTSEKIAILYAWNEYGEGAYLTPTKKGIDVLQGVKKALLLK